MSNSNSTGPTTTPDIDDRQPSGSGSVGKSPKADDEATQLSKIKEFAKSFTEDEEMFLTAVKAVEIKNYGTATELFRSLMEKQPEKLEYELNHTIAKFLGSKCRATKEYMEEMEVIQRKLKINSNKISERDARYPCFLYNLAELLYHRRSFRQAINILEVLECSLRRSPSLSRLWMRTAMLHVEILLRTHKFAEALVEIQNVESQLQSQMEASTSMEVIDIMLVETIQIRLQQSKTLCHLCTRSLTNAKREYKTLCSITGANHPSGHIGTCLKAYHDYLRRNVKKAEKTMVLIRKPFTVLKKNHSKFMKSGDNFSLIFQNNFACCANFLYSPDAAGLFFRNALDEGLMYMNQAAYNRLPIYAAIKLQAEMDIVRYNLGITLSANKKNARAAFALLTYSVKCYPLNPKLWLRIAEACMDLCIPSLGDKASVVPEKYDLFQDLTSTVPEDSVEGFLDSIISTYVPRSHSANTELKPTLKYAKSCLTNAKTLVVPAMDEGSVDVFPSHPIINPNEISSLYVSILSATAYVTLYSESSAFLTVKNANAILAVPGVPSPYKYLATLYRNLALVLNQKAESSIFDEKLQFDENFAFVDEKKVEPLNAEVDCGGAGAANGFSSDSTIQRVPRTDPFTWFPRSQNSADIIQKFTKFQSDVYNWKFSETKNSLSDLLKQHGTNIPPAYVKLYTLCHLLEGDVDPLYDIFLKYSFSFYCDVAMKGSEDKIPKEIRFFKKTNNSQRKLLCVLKPEQSSKSKLSVIVIPDKNSGIGKRIPFL